MKVVRVCPEYVTVLQQWMVDDGAQVTEGDIICMTEAMKMMADVRSPATGTLRYRAQLGQIVGQNEPIAVIEVPDASA